MKVFKKKKGAKLRSGFEDKILNQLRYSKTQTPWVYEFSNFPYIIEKRYIVDFTLPDKDIYIECKGWFKPSDRTKMLAVKNCNPSADIRLIFQSDNWLTNKKKQRYSDWAKKHGFQYAIGSIPKEWLD